MIEKLILIAVALLMLIFTLRKRNKHTIALTSGLTIGILLTLIESSIVLAIGIFIFTLASLMIVIYGFKEKEITQLDKIGIIITGIFAVYSSVSSLLYFPFAAEFKISLIIPIVFYLILIIKGLSKKKEFGFLTILNIVFLYHFFQY